MTRSTSSKPITCVLRLRMMRSVCLCRLSRDMRSNATCKAQPARMVNSTMAAIRDSERSIRWTMILCCSCTWLAQRT